MLRTLVRGFPPKAVRSTVDLEKVIEFSAVICDVVRQRQPKQATVLRETNDARAWLDQRTQT